MIIIVSPEGVITKHALHLKFPATNNKVEYEAIIVGLGIAKELGVQDLKIYSDSQLIIEQVNNNYKAWEESMIKYL